MGERVETDPEQVEFNLVLNFRVWAKLREEATPERQAAFALVKLLHSLLWSEPGCLDQLVGAQAEFFGRRVEVSSDDLRTAKEFLVG